MPGPREWSPRGVRKYTIIGLWADNSQPWLEFTEGTSPERALRDALQDLRQEHDWDEETLKDLFIVEIVEGHRRGLLENSRSISAYTALTGKRAD